MSDENDPAKSYPRERRAETSDGFSGGERRKMSYGVLYSCNGSAIAVKEWLEGHCQGDHSMVLDDLDEDLRTTKLRIMFELETDKAVFISDFVKRG